MGDLKARFTGVPMALVRICLPSFRLYSQQLPQPFAIHQQLLDLEEAFFQAGYVSWTYGAQCLLPASNGAYYRHRLRRSG